MKKVWSNLELIGIGFGLGIAGMTVLLCHYFIFGFCILKGFGIGIIFSGLVLSFGAFLDIMADKDKEKEIKK